MKKIFFLIGRFFLILQRLFLNKQSLDDQYYEIVVKVMTKSIGRGVGSFSTNEDLAEMNKTLKIALDEVSIILAAEHKIVFKNCITHVYGISQGIMPDYLRKLLNVSDKSEAIGIILRYEGKTSLISFYSFFLRLVRWRHFKNFNSSKTTDRVSCCFHD